MTVVPEVRIRVLGGVQVQVAGRPVDPLPARAVDLLALLASQPGRVQPRALVASQLWPDSSDAQARTNLRRELHNLRRVLGETTCLTTSVDGLGWASNEAVEVDVVGLIGAQAQALAAAEKGNAVALRQAIEVVLAAEAEFLPACHDGWADEVRDRLHRTTVEVCDRATAFWLGAGRPEEALPVAKLRTRLEPLEESGWLHLIAAHRANGDLASALSAYHRCAATLEEELGVAPGAALRAALEEVLDQQADPTLAAPDGPSSPGRPGTDQIPLVGRGEQLDRLLRAWNRTSSAGRRLVVIVGEPGVGKTALMDELVGCVRERSGVVATARCHTATSGLPLAPLSQWMRAPHLRQATARLDPTWRAEVERLAPVPADRMTPAPGRNPSRRGARADAWQRVRFYESLVRAVVAVGRPVLLTLDDLQWCDRATLSWIAFLLGTQLPVPVLVVATARRGDSATGPLADVLGSLIRAGHAELLELDELDDEEMSRLAEAVVRRPLGAGERALLRSATNGNPMSVIEAAREADSPAGPIRPESLHTVLRHRLDRLTEPELSIVQALAAIGRDAGLDLLSGVTGLSDGEVARLVDRLCAAHLLTGSGPHFDFGHDLIREAAYASIGEARRFVLHRHIAEALEQDPELDDGTQAVALADQYVAAGLPQRALPLIERAAHDAMGIFALDVSIELTERALSMIARQPPSHSRDEHELGLLCDLLPPVTERLGYASERLEGASRRAADLSERLGRLADQAEALATLFSSLFVQARLREAEATAERALELTGAVAHLRGQGHLVVAGAVLSLGEFARADAHFEQACALAPEDQLMTNGTHTAIHARAWWAHARHLCGDPDGARTLAAQTVSHARRLAHPWSLTVALSYQAVTLQLGGDRDGLGGTLRELIPLCARYRFAYYDSWAMVLDGWLTGGDAGRAATAAGIERLQAARSLSRLPYWLWLHADVCRRAGDVPSARAALDSAEVHALAHEDVWWLPEVRLARAALA